jgi:hypothetical protein
LDPRSKHGGLEGRDCVRPCGQRRPSVLLDRARLHCAEGASAAVTGGPWFTSTVVPVQVTAGSDAGSGVDPGSLVVERDYAPLEGEDEGGWKGDERRFGEFHGHWTRVKLVDNSGPTVTQPGCYRYRIRVSDNVGNRAERAGDDSEERLKWSSADTSR